MKSLTSILAPPLLCAGIIAGIVVEKSTHVKPQDAAPYHAAAAEAINKMGYTIGDPGNGIWVGEDTPQPQAAVQLLRPNVILSRRYSDTSSSGRGRYGNRVCNVLIVQCGNSRDMVGHYPENCYPAIGEPMVGKTPRDWKIGDRVITGTEYTFERFSSRGRPVRRCVYSFLVVPGVGIVRDIKGVNKAAENYQRRHFGAAQFQFVMDADLSLEERDRIFATLMGANMDVFDTLINVKTTN
jgi:hypothetical protein